MMEGVEQNVVLVCVLIGLVVSIATLLTGNSHVVAWSVLPLGIAAWRLYATLYSKSDE
jgi:hypothetical protein